MVVAVLRSWKTIGEEAGDIAENLFLHVCRMATDEASATARLSTAVFAAYWDEPARERRPLDVLTRWLPAELSAPAGKVPIDAQFFAHEVAPHESARDIFERVASGVADGALLAGWDSQVG